MAKSKKVYKIGGFEVKGANDIKNEVIWADIDERGEADKKWLKKVLTEEVKKPSGKMAKRTFIEVRKEFLKKYYPELAPKEKQKGMTVQEMLDKLNAELGE